MDECCCLPCVIALTSIYSAAAGTGFSNRTVANPNRCGVYRQVIFTLREADDAVLIWQIQERYSFPGNLRVGTTLDHDGGASGIPIGSLPSNSAVNGVALDTPTFIRYFVGPVGAPFGYHLELEFSEELVPQDVSDVLPALLTNLAELQGLPENTYWIRQYGTEGDIVFTSRGENVWFFDMPQNGAWLDCFNIPDGGLVWRVISQRAKRTAGGHYLIGGIDIVQTVTFIFWEISSYVRVRNGVACIVQCAIVNAAVNPICDTFGPVCDPNVSYAGADGEFMAVPPADLGSQAIRCGLCPAA